MHRHLLTLVFAAVLTCSSFATTVGLFFVYQPLTTFGTDQHTRLVVTRLPYLANMVPEGLIEQIGNPNRLMQDSLAKRADSNILSLLGIKLYAEYVKGRHYNVTIDIREMGNAHEYGTTAEEVIAATVQCLRATFDEDLNLGSYELQIRTNTDDARSWLRFKERYPLADGSLEAVDGGVSPDRRLVVAVAPQKKGEFMDQADVTVHLVDRETGKRIGQLKEVDSSGGTWGTTTENVSAAWSPTGRYVAVNHRKGMTKWGFQLYRMDGKRAIAVKLPGSETHSKSEVFAKLTASANGPGATAKWESESTLIGTAYGYTRKDEHLKDDFSVYGLADFTGTLEIGYTVDKRGRWKVSDIRTPRPEQ